MSEKDDNEIKPYTGPWSYRTILKLLPLAAVFAVMAYLKTTGRLPF